MNKKRKSANEPFRYLLARLRLQRGLNRTEMAKLLGVHLSTISYWEAGIYVPSADKIRTLAQKLGINTRSLVDALLQQTNRR